MGLKHSWANRMVPPLIIAAVAGCVAYALHSRPEPLVANSTPSTQPVPSTAGAHADATTAPSVSPTVEKLGGQLQFSVNAVPYKHIERVEFYVENQFVGAAYNQPYKISVNENNLTAGSHTVTARIYMGDSTAESQPATFTAQPTSPPATPADTEPAGSASSVAPTPPPATPVLASPQDLTVTVATDGTSATLTWTTVANATGYQVWRDGTQITTTTGSGYTDTGLTPGQTYDYAVVAFDGGGNISAPSTKVAATMPTPQSAESGTNEPGGFDTNQSPVNQSDTDMPIQ